MNQSFQQLKEDSEKDFFELVEGTCLKHEEKLKLERFYQRTFDRIEQIYLYLSAETNGVKRLVDNCQLKHDSSFKTSFDNCLKDYLQIRVTLISWAVGIIGTLLLVIWSFYSMQIMSLTKKMDLVLDILQKHETRITVLETKH